MKISNSAADTSTDDVDDLEGDSALTVALTELMTLVVILTRYKGGGGG